VGSYTRTEYEACIASLPSNGHLNRVLKVAGLAHGPCPMLVSVVVLRKKKADDVVKVSSKCPKVPEKKGAEPMKVSGACTSGGPKWPSVADILLAKFVRLSKGIIPYAIASAATVRIMPEPRGSENLLSDLGSKVGGKGPVYKTMPGAKAMPGAKVVFPSLRSASFRLLGLWL
jgi:hypothetical protein